jgi:predicted  nucleic acid-binding Zn-ribbon protein
MTVEILNLEATLKQVRKEKQITEMLCANLTNNNSEPLLKLVDSLGKTVAQFETVNQKFMPTLHKINHNINEISLIRDRITATKEQRNNVEKRILYLVDPDSGSTASKSAAHNELDSLNEQATICTHTEERDSKQLLDLTESTNELQQQLTQDVNSLDFYFKKINRNYDQLLKRIEVEKANESFIKTVIETGDISGAKQNVIRTLKSST